MPECAILPKICTFIILQTYLHTEAVILREPLFSRNHENIDRNVEHEGVGEVYTQ